LKASKARTWSPRQKPPRSEVPAAARLSESWQKFFSWFCPLSYSPQGSGLPRESLQRLGVLLPLFLQRLFQDHILHLYGSQELGRAKQSQSALFINTFAAFVSQLTPARMKLCQHSIGQMAVNRSIRQPPHTTAAF